MARMAFEMGQPSSPVRTISSNAARSRPGILIRVLGWFGYPVSMVGLTHGIRSNTLPPSAALALGVWQCGAMLLLQNAVNRWLARARPWLGWWSQTAR